jgi:Protein of unknown function (DUF1553)/Protein of unknown function (DUF1549)
MMQSNAAQARACWFALLAISNPLSLLAQEPFSSTRFPESPLLAKQRLDNKPLENPAQIQEPPITDSDRDHWSFQPIITPPVPTTSMLSWTDSPIDSFVLSRLEQAGLAPAPEADRGTLLRRLKLDLLGLPPTPNELAEFLHDCDRDADAYQRWAEKWLSSPDFGQRQAQPWLDLARFAETDGFEHDRVRNEAWRYRDWVISAFNQDLPYDRFIGLQLHGDLTGSKEDQIATMFCLASADMPDINDQDLRRHDRLNELTSTIGAALLGLQMHCAQCHDHKYDPISQGDFYRLRGVFESSIPELKRDQPFNLFAGNDNKLEPRLYFRGDLRSPGPIVEAAFPRIGIPEDSSANCDTQRPRESFSKWLFAQDNPLVARVIVNRVWMHHFGRGLFETASDVGVVPAGPTHPELLDWLAGFLREHQWSLKALHREIVLSATYRQASRQETNDREWSARLAKDPKNNLYSRFPRRRLDGEVIRDSLLSVAGLLQSEAGGESVLPPLPKELTGTLLKGQWPTSGREADHYRRSIFIFARRNLRYPLFDVFDRPDAGDSCPQRNRSTTATQSLQMLNSELSNRCAAALSQRVTEDCLEHDELTASNWISRLFVAALARPATVEEVSLFESFFANESSRRAACLAILNSNEFLTVD